MLTTRDTAGHDPESAAESSLPKRTLLLAVARRGLPGILEATLMPAAIFLLTSKLFGTRWAMVAVLAWASTMFVWRRFRGRRPPALVIVGLGGLAVRTLIGVLSGSAFFYFVQPVATMIAVASLFVVSLAFGRPFIARVAHDFCPMAADVVTRPSVKRLFVGLTAVWAGSQLLNAGATVAMLLSLDTSLFVVLKPLISLSISALAVFVTVRWALRVAQREQLVFAAL